jgi:Fic family protein
MSQFKLPCLEQDVETKVVLKLAFSTSSLAELNGVAETIPNEVIVLNNFVITGSKDSSAIENIITTHDELFSSDSIAKQF